MHDDRHLHRLSPLASISAWLAFGLAFMAGLGYLSGNTALTAFQPGWKAMAPLTAIGYAPCAAALPSPSQEASAQQPWQSWPATHCSMAMSSILPWPASWASLLP
jgi:hypothetical protein